LEISAEDQAGDESEPSEETLTAAFSALEFEAGLDDSSQPTDAEETPLGGDLGLDFDPQAETASTEPGSSADRALDTPLEFEHPSEDQNLPDQFAETEELTIDADLEQAAASISGTAGQPSALAEEDGSDSDLAIEAVATTNEDLLEDLDFEEAEGDEVFEFEDDGDSANTKLDLARAYIDMGDSDGARDILREVLDEGNSDQQQKAQSLLEAL